SPGARPSSGPWSRASACSTRSRTCTSVPRSPLPDPANPLRRSRRHRLIAGVCGGLAEWLGWDVTLVRVGYVLVSVLSAAFPGTIVYLILWLVVPERTS